MPSVATFVSLCSFWSMPQGREKRDSEEAEMQVMLPNINLLYLFCSTLILLDLSFMSRFWHVRGALTRGIS
jgi:hypothetical protein